MTRLGKLVRRITARPPQADFNDVRQLLEAYGYAERGQKGSHHAFKKPGHRTIIVPTVGGRMVKRVYLDQICGILGLDD